MTEQHHDEIARRLRETGTVQAPDRLRAEVMSQVRAEPRVRRPRLSFFAPVMPYAAAAAALVVVVLAVSHLGGGGSGSNSAGAGASGGGGIRAPEATKDAGGASSITPDDGKATFSLRPYDAAKLARGQAVIARRSAHAFVLRVPPGLYADYVQRLRKIERRTHGRDTIRVILKPTS
jgi:hypothetical protein